MTSPGTVAEKVVVGTSHWKRLEIFWMEDEPLLTRSVYKILRGADVHF